MEILTADFETYYDKDYSLSKLTMEEYIRDPRFEVIMLGVQFPDGTKRVIEGSEEDIRFGIEQIDWSQYAVLCHNTLFDGAIFSWRYGVRPAAWLDTLSMARAMFGGRSNSLAALAERYSLQEKGTAVQNMLGKRRADMSRAEFAAYAEYCLNDVDLTHKLFTLMSEGWYDLTTFDRRDAFPLRELELIDAHIRMYTEPALVLNKEKLEAHLAGVVAAKEALLSKSGFDKEALMSNIKFAEVLQSLGVDPPRKISPTTGKETFAFAKTDADMKALLEHSDERVQAVAAARMGVKSTLEETRTQRFIDIASRDPLFPVPLRYSAARTHRSGGTDGINMQNLPARGAQAGKLKRCIEAPPGHVLIDCDSSNIEARMLAWLAGQDDLCEDFANGVDVYCKMAGRIYGREITKADKLERFLGKTVTLGCFGPDTQVLTNSGWKSIVQVTLSDRLWDGESWVKHAGLLSQGYRVVETPMDLMLHATADHEILTEHGWRVWSEVHSNSSLFQSAINRGRLPSSIGSNVKTQRERVSGGTQKCSVNVDGSAQSTEVTLKTNVLDGVTLALKEKLTVLANYIGGTPILSKTLRYAKASLIEYQNASLGVNALRIKDTVNTEAGAYASIQNGCMTEKNFSDISYLSMDGITSILSLIGSTITKAMSRVILDGRQGEKTYSTGGVLTICKRESSLLKQKMPTYDIALSGPNNRFTVLTNKGPIIVHNCGYQTGALKLQVTLKNADPPMLLSEEECSRIIQTYRNTYNKIPELWAQGEAAIEAIHRNQSMWFGREGVVLVEGKKGVRLPSGLYITYPQLHRGTKKLPNGSMKEQWQYKDTTGLTGIYGGKFTENIVQALARIVVMYQLLKIRKRYQVVLTVHDAVACIAPVEEAKEAQAFVEQCMRWVPKWAQGCPINCESGIGTNYGEC